MEIESTKLQKGLLAYIFLTLTIVLGFAFPVHAGTQVVTFSPEQVVVTPGRPAELVLVYDVSTGTKQTTGLGIRIHYNSRAIVNLNLQDFYGEGLIAQDQVAQDDADDFDNDPSTDKYVGVAWMGITGDWPKLANLPAELGKIFLKIRSDIKTPTTRLNITSSSTPAGYSFQGRSAEVTMP